MGFGVEPVHQLTPTSEASLDMMLLLLLLLGRRVLGTQELDGNRPAPGVEPVAHGARTAAGLSRDNR